MSWHDADGPPRPDAGDPPAYCALMFSGYHSGDFQPAYDWLTAHGAEGRRATIRSPHGHDAFLIEWETLDPLVRLAAGDAR